MIEVNILKSGVKRTLEVPKDMGLNLMELLKGEEYESIEGTCGGMALCATCHIKVKEAAPALSGPLGDELDMLETLPFIYKESRLACQIKLNENIRNLTVELVEN
ncbi:MAG: 2Fe-2S iron-sulfur cluster binding domain-containing protein [Saprospiraceae bacterium]|jgi:2Fe-2S ferredoxin|nr:2Fe-2S iron-sulfur cluster binding domain-containing protein [Saprospiraceae bacterium]